MNEFIISLDKWAKKQGLSYTVSYWEAEGTYEVQIHSAAPSEQFYRKRNYNFESFLEIYNERGE